MAKDGDIVDVLLGFLMDAFLWVCKIVVKVVLAACKYAWYLLLFLINWVISLFDKDKKADAAEQNPVVNSEIQSSTGDVSE
jgi:hypothetical protein